MLNFRSRCGVQASETIHGPTRCLGEHWVEAKHTASAVSGARTELAHDAMMWNRSHGAKKKGQISTFHHIEGFTLGTRKVPF